MEGKFGWPQTEKRVRGNEMGSGRGIVPSCLLFSGGVTVGSIAGGFQPQPSLGLWLHLQVAVGRWEPLSLVLSRPHPSSLWFTPSLAPEAWLGVTWGKPLYSEYISSGRHELLFYTISKQWLYLSINVCYHHSCFSFLSWGHLGEFFFFFFYQPRCCVPEKISENLTCMKELLNVLEGNILKTQSDWPEFKWFAIPVLLQCTKLMWGVWIVRLMNSN